MVAYGPLVPTQAMTRPRSAARLAAAATRLLAHAAMAALLCACGGGASSAAPPGAATPAVAPGTWVVLGSSTAAGTGASPGQGWVAQLATRATALPAAAVTVVNLARAGAVTYQALPTGSLPPAGRPAPDPALNVDLALTRVPRLLLLAFPGNDAVAGYGADETMANLLRLSDVARAGDVAVILLSSQPRDRLTAAQQATLDAVDRQGAAAFGACFVDVHSGLAGPDGGIAAAYAAGDGVHLNDAGHRVLADRVWAVLESGRCVRLGAS